MNHVEYNGWTNYETWCVALWLDNEEGSYNCMGELAEEHREDTSDLANAIKDMIEEQTPDLGASMFADLLGAALSEVNWYEIAEHYIADLDPIEEATA